MFSIGVSKVIVVLKNIPEFVSSQRNNKVISQLDEYSPFPFRPFRYVLFSRYM